MRVHAGTNCRVSPPCQQVRDRSSQTGRGVRKEEGGVREGVGRQHFLGVQARVVFPQTKGIQGLGNREEIITDVIKHNLVKDNLYLRAPVVHTHTP